MASLIFHVEVSSEKQERLQNFLKNEELAFTVTKNTEKETVKEKENENCDNINENDADSKVSLSPFAYQMNKCQKDRGRKPGL